MISMKAEGGDKMSEEKEEDIKNTAFKLNEIYSQYPEDYFYLKGWIHCLLEKEKNDESHNQETNIRT